MAVIAFCTGTTAEWKAVEDQVILREREIALEITENGKTIMRRGNGKDKFFSLPPVIDGKQYAEDMAAVQGYMETIFQFSQSMTGAAEAANLAAATAAEATQEAQAAAAACEGIVDGMNTMVDTETNRSYQLGVSDGKLYIEEIEEGE